MASKVHELQFALDKVAELAKHGHVGASDRRRTLMGISVIIEAALENELSRIYNIPEPKE